MKKINPKQKSMISDIMRMNHGVTSTEIFGIVQKSKRKREIIKMGIYLLNMTDHLVVARFDDEITANEIGRTSKYDYLVIEKAKDLGQITVPLLNKIRKGLVMETGKNKKEALAGIWKKLESLVFSEPAPTPRKKKKAAKKRGPSRREKILALFEKNKGVITKDQIAEGLGIKNPAACMASLANPVKTKEPLLNQYDKEKKTYTLIGHDKKK